MLNLIKRTPQATFYSIDLINVLKPLFGGLNPIRHWLNKLEINNVALAHFICKMIPVQCPFERDICLFGRNLIHIPPLCKLNPLYEELTVLRFRALCYLADECGEDVRCYC
ncbi:Mo-dependent nitrogenase C-terminal domain-containing protein [Rivularia sp. UHCC 0363]|uniref:Mo-dependent nitrogenase C-terminal domain-containing protein n=1 Tax=Rivularia sp. UHCC 0363 TaxID=3110244 RepID=UPI002B2067BC|nr:Mo-dependent nitrogenase C-terminal domain-containing protein [Rivularia sp. UHCC 0363]MEA5593145.1 Mo-dependent nitrogenase C-terminal domain-containing protein [Rivularia sp. UHCC 0363]